MNIIRKYKLNKLKYYDLNEEESYRLNIIFKNINYNKKDEELIEFIYNNFFDLKEIKLNNFQPNDNCKLYFKGSKFILHYIINNELLWINEAFFNFINKFKKDNIKTSLVITKLISEIYKINIYKTICSDGWLDGIMEINYKNEYN